MSGLRASCARSESVDRDRDHSLQGCTFQIVWRPRWEPHWDAEIALTWEVAAETAHTHGQETSRDSGAGPIPQSDTGIWEPPSLRCGRRARGPGRKRALSEASTQPRFLVRRNTARMCSASVLGLTGDEWCGCYPTSGVDAPSL